jgi:hypothetical protein
VRQVKLVAELRSDEVTETVAVGDPVAYFTADSVYYQALVPRNNGSPAYSRSMAGPAAAR